MFLEIKNRIAEVKTSIDEMEDEVIFHKADLKKIQREGKQEENKTKDQSWGPTCRQWDIQNKQKNTEKWSRGNQEEWFQKRSPNFRLKGPLGSQHVMNTDLQQAHLWETCKHLGLRKSWKQATGQAQKPNRFLLPSSNTARQSMSSAFKFLRNKMSTLELSSQPRQCGRIDTSGHERSHKRYLPSTLRSDH